ncbi:hypothetical protein ACH4E7_25920 [Kitasatospora sp. NPDC018058]|uniref:hypothetical protein n=1 Tax=Kitasatospora sp. NPDC018058 TaxID=3364025 RepID=UPI0037C05FA1
MLFQGGDPGLELFGVVRPVDAHLAPDLLAKRFAEPLLEATDPGGGARRAGVAGREVGLEEGAADGRTVAAGGGGQLSALWIWVRRSR